MGARQLVSRWNVFRLLSIPIELYLPFPYWRFPAPDVNVSPGLVC